MKNLNTLGTAGFRNQTAMLYFFLTLCLTGFSAMATQAATVSGRVWLDGNRNGLQDNNEPGLDGVYYFLIEVDVNNVETEYFIGITGSTGAYSINIPNTGNFRVRIANPTNSTNTYTFTLQDVNGNGSDAIDSDFDYYEGKTEVFAVTSMSQTFDYDAGFKLISTNEEDGGCTLTQGYWKTHSKYGPAPYDPTWALQGEDTPFFLSGKTWYEVLWTPPSGGNGYYILAHQYIAARLNFLNGASSTQQVTAAFNAATTLFNTYTPAQWSGLPKSVKDQFISLASTLDQYNNGIIGPGHCGGGDDEDDDFGDSSEDRSSAFDLEANDVKLSPNPARDLVRIELPATFTLATDLHLMNGMGQVVLHERVPAGEYRTELQLTGAEMPSGVYYLRVQSGDVIQTQKLVLVK
ncbi:MAG: SdrD B-like domain-containing protein [Saprospiraceae bacterium]|nr:SdrD B-like domain-containing protein [Saprospiraceae bacterium]